jgi:hypothetical protein
MTANQTEAMHLRLITFVNEPKTELGRDKLCKALLPEATPGDREFYLVFLALSWGKLCVYSVMALSVVAFLFTTVSGNHGTTIWVALLVGVSAFCITGMADVAWRSLLVRAARNRWARTGRIVDQRSRRLMHFSRINDGTFLLQIAACALAVWYFS